MKVLIADDHDVVRRGLKQILADEFGTDIQFGEARNGEETLTLAGEKNWDAIILDINMPGKSGLDVMKELKQARPKLPVLVLSVQPEDQYAIPVLKAGASGYLTKDSASEELVNAFKKIISGGKYVSATVAEKLAESLGPKSQKSPHEQLSYREFQVLRLIALGKTSTEIAEELKLSVQTVSTYRTRILKKMKMENNAELMRYAMQTGVA
jgi:two-component system invasion response regulator UvrY